jgi:hypothetical protein
MDEAQFLKRCKDLAGDTSRKRWTRDHMAGFFQIFRPDGTRLEPLFNDIPDGLDVYQRLRQVYIATAGGSDRGQEADAYFVVRNPRPATDSELRGYALSQLSNWRQMAEAINQSELVDLLTPIPHVAVSHGIPPEPDPNDTESLDVFIYDVQTDWHAQLMPQCPHTSWMREAFYYIDCDYYLARYVTWPWYKTSSSITEPYEPHFRLWSHGAALCCESPQNITLFVTAVPKAG